MPCYYPLKGYRSKTVNPSGKRGIVFDKSHGFVDMPVTVPCGRCIGCRLERSRQWAIRCVHEASLHEKNCFITLTYSPENIPKDNSLVKRDFQLFMKKLRKKYGNRIRFFHCGEYGEEHQRPHYHALLFGIDFKEESYYASGKVQSRYWISKLIKGEVIPYSPELEQIWGKGHTAIGEVTFESAAYVARYITKKITGEDAIDHYNTIDYSTGEVLAERIPEYILMSRRPGIAAAWFQKYYKEIYGYDSIVLNGKEMKPPKFYDKKYEDLDKKDLRRVKQKRVEKAQEFVDDDSSLRLITRERIQLLNEQRRKKKYEKPGIFSV